MGLVEPGNCWEALAASGVGGDDDFPNILSILDFPMESLEGDDVLVGDWDANNSQYLGPIPSDVLMGPPATHGRISCGPPYALPEPAPCLKIDGRVEQKQLADRAEAVSSPLIPLQNKLNRAQDAGVFQTQSPVSVLESNGSYSATGKSLMPIKQDVAIPVRARSKRVRPSGVNPWLLISPLFATTKRTSNSRRSKERRKRSSHLSSASIETMREVSDNDETAQTGFSQLPVSTKKCTHCEVTKTPQWREGPLGPKTLCNACGVRYRSGRLFPEYRPAASPTFIPSVHSNSHKKVIEMRNKAKQLGPANVEVPPMSPQPEFVPMSGYLFDCIF